jgi:hypothetical protein
MNPKHSQSYMSHYVSFELHHGTWRVGHYVNFRMDRCQPP